MKQAQLAGKQRLRGLDGMALVQWSIFDPPHAQGQWHRQLRLRGHNNMRTQHCERWASGKWCWQRRAWVKAWTHAWQAPRPAQEAGTLRQPCDVISCDVICCNVICCMAMSLAAMSFAAWQCHSLHGAGLCAVLQRCFHCEPGSSAGSTAMQAPAYGAPCCGP